MKKILAIILAIAAFVACSKDNQLEPATKPDASKGYTMTIKASKEVETKALSLSGKTLNTTWDANEEVLVYQNNAQIGTLYAAASSTASTTLSGELTSAPDPDAALTFYFHTNLVPDSNSNSTAFIENGQYLYYAGQDGTLETIASTYDFCNSATVASGNFTVDTDSKKVVVSSGISFGSNLQAIVKFTLVDKANPETKLNASSLTITASRQSVTASNNIDINYTFSIPASTYETNGDGIVYLAIPAYKKLTAGTTDPKCFAITATVGSDTYIYGRSDFPLANGKYYDITVKMAPPIYATSADLGKIIGKNGQIYENVEAATTAGTDAVAMIAYVGDQTGELAPYNHGLAIALNDSPDRGGDQNPNYQYYTQISNFQSHTYTYPPVKTPNTTPDVTPFAVESGLQYNTLHKNYIDGNGFLYPAFRAAIYSFYVIDKPSCFSEWFLGSGFQWQQMINAMGSFSNLRTAFSSIGGTDMALTMKNSNEEGAVSVEAKYWTSTHMRGQPNPAKAWYFTFSGNGGWGKGEFVDDYYKVRPVLAF